MAENFLKRNRIFSIVSGFLLGTAFASVGLNSVSLASVCLLIAVSLGVYTMSLLRNHTLRDFFVFISIFVLFASLGVFRFISSEIKQDPILDSHVGEKVKVLGIVVREPKDGDSYRQYALHTDSGSNVLVRATPFPGFQFGDRLSVFGKLELPKTFETPQGTTFNYPAYRSKEWMAYIMSGASVEKVE